MKCFELHESCSKNCANKTCKLWIQSDDNQNCTLIAAQKGPMSLQQIGDILGVTRMRICQIEKKVIEKLADHIM
jgi:DNA-directed RNA polymerase specialized sigma subunit